MQRAITLPLFANLPQINWQSKKVRLALISVGAIVILAALVFVAMHLFTQSPAKPVDPVIPTQPAVTNQAQAVSTEVAPPQVVITQSVPVEAGTAQTVVTSQITFPSGTTATLYPDGHTIDQNGFVRGLNDGYIVAAAAPTYPCTFGTNAGLLHIVADERLMGSLTHSDTLPFINNGQSYRTIYYVGWAASTPTWGVQLSDTVINRSLVVTINGTQCVPEAAVANE